MSEKLIKFSIDDSRTSKISGFKERFASYADKDFYSVALDFMIPKSSLLHVLTYD